MITVKKNLVGIAKYPIKCPYKMTPQFIVVHNTANDASASDEIAYMIRNLETVSFHFAVDDKEVVQGLPLDRNGWHAGDSAKGKGNRNGIGVEICYSKSGGEKFDKAEKLAAAFVAQLLHERGWGISKVTKHQDYSGKYCPHRTLDKGWPRFLNMVSAELDKLVAKPVRKTVEEIAKEVLAGKWGNGSTRKTKLAAAGYNYNEVQAKVNELLKGGTKTATKSVTEIAKEVIAGKWGNGSTRKKKLTAAGYNYAEVQRKVNDLLK